VRPPRRLIAAILALAVLPATANAGSIGHAASTSLALFSDTQSVTHAIATDTLDPPTSLSATGGTSVALTWTATPDTYAAGYDVQRATVSGGPYTLIGSVAPRTTVATTDSPPAAGTYYYVLRSTFQNWTSVNSNQASATTSPTTTTGYKACTATSNAPEITNAGDNNGYQTTPNLACSTTDGNAVDPNTGTNNTLSCTDNGKDKHRWWDFNLGVPNVVSSVSGIQVRTDVGTANNNGTSWICAQLSWDGGTTWTTAKSVVLMTSAITTYTLGGAADTWGRTWTGSNFSNANFRVRVIDVSDASNKDFMLDYLAVQVTYIP